MKISQEEVRHVAKLARLELSDKEVEKFSGQLSSVFEYMDVLSEANTDGVMETSQVTGLENVSDKDEVSGYGSSSGVVGGGSEMVVGGGEIGGGLSGGVVSREDLLACTKLPVLSKQILVKAAIKK